MKEVTIVGVGMSVDSMTSQGLRAVEQADVLIGAPRLIALFDSFGKPLYGAYLPDAISGILQEHKEGRFCILVSGDTGFYSGAAGLLAVLKDCSVTFVPGVSSLSFFFARLMRPWQDAAVISCHGRRANIVDTVRRHPLTFALTGGNVAAMGEELTAAGFGDLVTFVGENLGLPNERIRTMPARDLAQSGTDHLAVLLIENDAHDDRARSGIPDEEFLRGNVPMTKSEIRAVTMSRLALHPWSVCCDIGAGTGSVTVEMALSAYQGHVYALDKNPEALDLVVKNCEKFHIGNTTPLLGEATRTIGDLPPLDAAFIGGSQGRLEGIFEALRRNNPRIRIVLAAVTLETIHHATCAFASHGMEPEIIQVAVTRARLTGDFHMLKAGSPVFIISGGGHE